MSSVSTAVTTWRSYVTQPSPHWGALVKERTVTHLSIPGQRPECGRYSVSICGRQAGRQEGTTGPHTHLGGRHILKGDMAIGQLTGCNSHAVDVRLGIITLKILRRKKKGTDHSIRSLGRSQKEKGVERTLERGKTHLSPIRDQLLRLSSPTLLKRSCNLGRSLVMVWHRQRRLQDPTLLLSIGMERRTNISLMLISHKMG